MRTKCAVISLILLGSVCSAQDITGDLNTNIGDGTTVDSNNASTSETNNYNSGAPGAMSNPVPTAMAPTVMGAGGSDSCLMPSSRGIQISLFGLAEGSAVQDPECNRRKDSRLLGASTQVGGLGLQVAGISLMCKDKNVFKAMALANTPCPIMDVDTGRLLIGRAAFEKYRSKPHVFIVGYAQDKQFWVELLGIGRKLKDVPQDNNRESLSDRFRRNGRPHNNRSGDSGQRDNGSSEAVSNAGNRR